MSSKAKFPHILDVYQDETEGMDRAMTHQAPNVILESLVATLSNEQFLRAMDAQGFRAEEYLSTFHRLQGIARARTAARCDGRE